MFRFLSAAVFALIALAATSALAGQTMYVKPGVHLNARSGPSTSHHVVKVLSPGMAVTAIAHKGWWVKIKHGHGHAFVSKKFLTSHAPSHGWGKAQVHHAPAPQVHYKPQVTYKAQTATKPVVTYQTKTVTQAKTVYQPRVVYEPKTVYQQRQVQQPVVTHQRHTVYQPHVTYQPVVTHAPSYGHAPLMNMPAPYSQW